MRYRKKPPIVEAIQWHGEEVEGFDRIGKGLGTDMGYGWTPYYNLVLRTSEGTFYAVEGDWLIVDDEGTRAICESSIFERDYEPVGEV